MIRQGLQPGLVERQIIGERRDHGREDGTEAVCHVDISRMDGRGNATASVSLLTP